MILIVCPLRHLPEIVAERAPSHVVSLGPPGHVPPALPAGIVRLVLGFHDVESPRAGLVAPAEHDIRALLAFGGVWDRARPLLLHCELGISRSTAAAFVLACQAWPDMAEGRIAHVLRRSAPCATPNRRVVALADGLLGRGARMIAAVEAIGRGRDYAPYRSFDLALESAAAPIQ